MVGATLCFSLLDACAKWLVQGLPVIQVVWARFALHVLLLSLLNAVIYAAFNLLTRRMAAHESAEATQLLSAAVAAVVLAPFALAVWQAPAGPLAWAVLGPFIYQQILYMTLWGRWVFGQVPDGYVVAGAAVVVASGLFLLWLEMARAPVQSARPT